jgi:hypothetical protein
MKTWAQKNQTQLWGHLYKSELFACGSVDWNDKYTDDIKQKFNDLQQYLEQAIAQTEQETAE